MSSKLTDAHVYADELLAELREAVRMLDSINAAWDDAVRELERQYGEQAEQAKARIKGLEKELIKHAKRNAGEIFDGRDRVDLRHGALIYSVTDRVRRARDVTVERLEELGYTDGIKIEKKVWWDRLEQWPDERLINAGTERVRKETIEYELGHN